MDPRLVALIIFFAGLGATYWLYRRSQLVRAIDPAIVTGEAAAASTMVHYYWRPG